MNFNDDHYEQLILRFFFVLGFPPVDLSTAAKNIETTRVDRIQRNLGKTLALIHSFLHLTFDLFEFSTQFITDGGFLVIQGEVDRSQDVTAVN